MKYRMSKTTLCLACLATASYALSFTGAAIGLGFLGTLFETLVLLSLLRENGLYGTDSGAQGGGSEPEVR